MTPWQLSQLALATSLVTSAHFIDKYQEERSRQDKIAKSLSRLEMIATMQILNQHPSYYRDTKSKERKKMKLFKKHTETGEPKIPIITRKTKIMWACTGVTALAAVGSVIYDHVSEGSAPALPATGEEIKAVGENGVEYLIEAVEDAGDAIATATADAAADID